MTDVGLDPDWVATTIADALELAPPTASLDGFIGTGQMSRNARFSLEWPEGARGPASVVTKLPSVDPGTRSVAFDHGAYLAECRFYRDLAPLVDVVTPAVHAVHYEDNDFAIVLEDMAGSVQGDQFRDITDDELAIALDQAAALHAPVWNATGAAVFEPLRSAPEDRGASYEQLMPIFLGVVMERLGSGLDPDVVELLERLQRDVRPWILARASEATVVHGDFRPDNFLWAVADDAPPLAVVDWQTATLGTGVTDVMYLIGGAVEVERRRAIEAEALETYRGRLADRGVEYSASTCEHDAALATLHGVIVALAATTMADETERGDALFTLMLNRHGRHALDHDALGRATAT